MSLIKGLNKKRFQPHLCCLRNQAIETDKMAAARFLFDEIDCPKINLDFISFRKLDITLKLWKLCKFIKTNRIDILQTYFQDPTVMGAMAGKLTSVGNVIACFRDMGFWRKNENDIKMKAAYKLCTGYIANSVAVKNEFKKVYGLLPAKIDVIYNGIDHKNYLFDPAKRINTREPIKVAIVANLNRDVKRVDIFIKAAAYILKTEKNVDFYIAGDGPLKQALINLCKQLKIEKRVNFCGLVTTNVGGNPEIITDRYNGFLVPKNDYQALGKKILSIFEEIGLYKTIRNNAREYLNKNFSLDKCIRQYELYYQKLI
ncbi:MAG: hypothetical protein CSA42_08650 [Gammaproteobacteria bacterium]|nr:MAG: hypothetical protein CSA42_08650 [Gammaproteobacteria bacterium]